jgi:DNA-binding NarL/FixJ family response regulator
VERLHRRGRRLDASPPPKGEEAGQRTDETTDRAYSEVLRRLERGQKAADIAVDAVVAISTVRTHIRSILVKLEVSSQQQAIGLYREARRRGE